MTFFLIFEEGHSTLKSKKCFTFSAKKLNIFIILFLKKAPSTYFPSVTKSLLFFIFDYEYGELA